MFAFPSKEQHLSVLPLFLASLEHSGVSELKGLTLYSNIEVRKSSPSKGLAGRGGRYTLKHKPPCDHHRGVS